jgi:hypothetical protein
MYHWFCFDTFFSPALSKFSGCSSPTNKYSPSPLLTSQRPWELDGSSVEPHVTTAKPLKPCNPYMLTLTRRPSWRVLLWQDAHSLPCFTLWSSGLFWPQEGGVDTGQRLRHDQIKGDNVCLITGSATAGCFN